MKDQTKVNLIACLFILATILLMIFTFSSCTKAKPTDKLKPTEIDTTTYRLIKLIAVANNAKYRVSLQTMSDNKTHGNKTFTDSAMYQVKVKPGDSIWILQHFINSPLQTGFSLAVNVWSDTSLVYSDTNYAITMRYAQINIK